MNFDEEYYTSNNVILKFKYVEVPNLVMYMLLGFPLNNDHFFETKNCFDQTTTALVDE